MWRRHQVLVSGAWESAPWVIVQRSILTFFQTFVSLKQPIAIRREVEVIERVQGKVAEEDRFFKTLLDFGNLFKVSLISEPEHARRQKEKEEEEKRNMAGGRAMTDAIRRWLESRAPQQKKKDGPSKLRTKVMAVDRPQEKMVAEV
ncbi:unnamed protein product [Prunus armeniaca]|uniref:Uncharacterized protein n=1 Tax=Prunus armeniaca TaxID=36596 RepID=A0A6J5UPS2_PRUAR|nr:unnamed protein product [Prunus armeniaca]CAB4308916.1 unnamed protein product [Prunus armeniaca]